MQTNPWSLHTGGETRTCTLILRDSAKTLFAKNVQYTRYVSLDSEKYAAHRSEAITWISSLQNSKSNVNLKVALATAVTQILRAKDNGCLWRHALFSYAVLESKWRNQGWFQRRSDYFCSYSNMWVQNCKIASVTFVESCDNCISVAFIFVTWKLSAEGVKWSVVTIPLWGVICSF